MKIQIVPMTLKTANLFIEKHHRHHQKVQGHKFSIGCSNCDRIIGVATVGRPVSRILDDGLTLEVTRLCTDGTKNACSKLYSACWRAARSLGYRRLITYILNTESGTSLTAAGWSFVGCCGGGSWSRRGRPRTDKHPTELKRKYEKM